MAYHHLRRAAHSVGTSPGHAADGAAAPAQQQAVAQPAGSRKRRRSRDHPPTGGSDATSLSASKNQAQANLTKLEALSKRFPGKITVTGKLGLPNLSPAEWESAERQRECYDTVTSNGNVRSPARAPSPAQAPGRCALRHWRSMACANPFVRPTLHPPGGKCGLVSA